MNVLLIGAGGREHALAWKLAASPLLTTLYCAPGNPGIAQCATCVDLNADNPGAVIDFCRENHVELVVVGPEGPLVAGLVDALTAAGIKAFGPSAAAAQLEGSKGFAKDLCRSYGIPTAAYQRCLEAQEAKDYVAIRGTPIVIKADGLAAGKGVIIAQSEAEAFAAIDDCFSGRFGPAGAAVVVEEYLEGEEASFFALVDGKTALALTSAQDHKRIGEGDTGPNTGGMGAYSPAPAMTPALVDTVMARIINPTVKAMRDMGAPFVGVLYAGLMLTRDGPKLIEYNVRFGDPECQAMLPRLKSDLLPALLAAVEGGLAHFDLRWDTRTALTVVMANKGYPGSHVKGDAIHGLARASAMPEVTVFHAGTTAQGGEIHASGGRVLGVTALAANVRQAQRRAYEALAHITWPGAYYRRDIGWRATAREEAADKADAP
ncbi:MAG: phosphoribosylamine--glycine ligase [Pseudomonadota bacterium]